MAVDAHTPLSWATEEHHSDGHIDQTAKIKVSQVELKWQKKGELFLVW